MGQAVPPAGGALRCAPEARPRRSRDGGGGAVPPFERVAAGWESRRTRSAMVRAMGLAGLLLGLLLLPAVLVSTSFRRGGLPAESAPEPAEWDLASGAVREDSLWPLPQWLRTSPRQLQLAPSRFQLVHGAGSSAGPDCGLLQDAFRR